MEKSRAGDHLLSIRMNAVEQYNHAATLIRFHEPTTQGHTRKRRAVTGKLHVANWNVCRPSAHGRAIGRCEIPDR